VPGAAIAEITRASCAPIVTVTVPALACGVDAVSAPVVSGGVVWPRPVAQITSCSPALAGASGPTSWLFWCSTMPRIEPSSDANTDGKADAMVTFTAAPGPLGLVTITGCGPAGTSTGTCALIWLGET